MSRVIAITATIAAACLTGSASAITNPGFETGDTSGWTLYVPAGGSADVVTQHIANYGTYTPQEERYFLRLKTDGPGSYTRAEQIVPLPAGCTLFGWAAFDARDHMPYNDNASVQIYNSSGAKVAEPWYSDVATVGGYGDGPWTNWNWTAPSADTYTLRYKIANTRDSGADSYALFDCVLFNPLNLSKTDNVAVGDCVYAGGTLTYSISYDNLNNTNSATGVTLVDKLPTEVDFVSCTGGGVYNSAGTPVTHVINFEDLDPGYETYNALPAGYAGFTWSGDVYWTTKYYYPGSGYEYGTVGRVCIFTGWAHDIYFNGETFNFDGAYITSAWDSTEQVIVEGWLDGSMVYQETITTHNDQAYWFDFDYEGVDTVRFEPQGSSQIAIDNITYSIGEKGGHTVTWDIGTVPAGDPGDSFTLTVQVKSGTAGGTMMTNEATINGNEPNAGPTTKYVQTLVCTNLPPVAVCQNLTVPADGTCQNDDVQPEDVDAGSDDPDGDPITLSLSPTGPYPLGDTLVTLTVTDDGGLSDTCTATVTVVDDTPPTIESLAGMSLVQVGEDASFVAKFSDNCSTNTTWDFGDGTVTPLSPATSPEEESHAYSVPGVYTVTLTVEDDSGNSAEESVLVVVIISLPLDILPSDDPNYFTVQKKADSKSRLPMEVYGSEELDAADIDFASIRVAGIVIPVKISNDGDENMDGYADLVIHVNRRDLINALDLSNEIGNVVDVVVTGAAVGGSPIFEATDTILPQAPD